MIRFREKLYLGGEASRKKKKYIRAVKNGKSVPGLYLITYAASDTDMLDIIHSSYLRQRAVRERLPEIVGLACGRQEALRLVERMVSDCFRETGNCRVRDYLEAQERDKGEG